MSGYVWWFVIGFSLLVAELLTGTFYLLIIAVAMGAA
ncbi:MAG: NfeD family protein, partial [Thermoanaerobaculia bacterium]